MPATYRLVNGTQASGPPKAKQEQATGQRTQMAILSRTQKDDGEPGKPGRLLALDLGAKKVGVAVSDELGITVRPLPSIERRSWKHLVRCIGGLIESNDAKGLVIGLPVRLDGTEGEAAKSTRLLAEKFRRSVTISVYLQNESLTSFEAESALRLAGRNKRQVAAGADSEAAAIILRDFIAAQRTWITS